MYDTDGNPLTESQKEKEVKLVCDVTGNPEVCNEGMKFDACSANHEPDRLGMVCLFKKDGTEVEYSPQGFDRNSVGLVGGVSKTDSENSAIDGMFGRGNHSNTSSITAAAKTFYQTATGQDVLTGDSNKAVTVDNEPSRNGNNAQAAGTSTGKSGTSGQKGTADTSTGKSDTSSQKNDGGFMGIVQDSVDWVVGKVQKEVYPDGSTIVTSPDGTMTKTISSDGNSTKTTLAITSADIDAKKMKDYLSRVGSIPGLTQTKAVEIFQQHRNESLDDIVRLTKAEFGIRDSD